MGIPFPRREITILYDFFVINRQLVLISTFVAPLFINDKVVQKFLLNDPKKALFPPSFHYSICDYQLLYFLYKG